MASANESFNEFWQHYLRHHAQEGTRLLHVLGTGLVGAARGNRHRRSADRAGGSALGYLLAWTGHFLIERNRPAMVSHPAWAFLCDVRMFRLWLTGQLGSELEQARLR